MLVQTIRVAWFWKLVIARQFGFLRDEQAGHEIPVADQLAKVGRVLNASALASNEIVISRPAPRCKAAEVEN